MIVCHVLDPHADMNENKKVSFITIETLSEELSLRPCIRALVFPVFEWKREEKRERGGEGLNERSVKMR